MFPRFVSIVLALALVLSGCSQSKPSEQKAETQDKSEGCVRGEPEAILASGSDFRKISSAEAVEVVRTDSPIQLTIHHFGCTHYALDFELKWPDPRMPDPPVSLKLAAGLFEKLPAKEAYQPVIKSLAAALRKMAEEPYKQPLTMSETESLTATTPALNALRIRYDVAL